MRAKLITVVALLLLASGWHVHAQAPGPADSARLQPRGFTMAGVRYELPLPPKGELYHVVMADRDSVIVTDNAKSKDYTHHFALNPAEHDTPPFDRTLTLLSGNVLRYHVRENTGGGGFGPSSTLDGRVDVGAHAVSVVCWDQDKQRPVPEWCIAYLHHLKLAELQPAAPAADCPRVEVGVHGEKHCLRAEPSAVPGFKDCAACPEMVTVPAGSFMMGSPGPPRKDAWGEEQVPVTIARAFAVGRFAVTYAEWEACLHAGGCAGHRAIAPDGWGRDKRPLVGVTWDAAKVYVAWLSQTTGKSYRLPSEAEREYVTRAGTTTPYWWGSAITGDRANYDNRVSHAGGVDGFWLRKTVPVDTFAPNPWGLYNVHGNVYEWAEDCLNESNVGNPGDGTARTTGDCRARAMRGGSWQSFRPPELQSGSRAFLPTDRRTPGTGFRVVRDLD